MQFMNTSIKTNIENIGLSEAEANTYVALLSQSGGMSVLELSRMVNVPRATLYGHLETLLKAALVKKGLQDGRTVFYAESPTTITDLYDRRINELKSEREKFVVEMESYTKINSYYSPKFYVYDQSNAASQILWDVLRAKEKETYWLWPISEMVRSIPVDVLNEFHQERMKRGIWLNVLWPDAKRVEQEQYSFMEGSPNEKNFMRRVRILPKEIDQTTGYGIYGTKVAFLSSEQEHYGFVIDSKELTKTFKNQFDYFWSISKTLTSK